MRDTPSAHGNSAGRVALITGITGQDGSYLSELLLSRGYRVHGLFRPDEPPGLPEVVRHDADLTDAKAVARAIGAAAPDELYHLGAQSFVHGEEVSTVHVNVNGTLHVLEAVRRAAPACRVFFASSAEVFGEPETSPQDERTPMRPRNIYGVTKVAGLELMRVYREQHRLFTCCAILYNHESPRRGPNFVTRKITRAAARIKLGLESELRLGNLDAVRDWGRARDYVRGMWLMLQQTDPDDYVLATGQGRTVRDFVEAAFSAAGLDWQQYVRTAPEYWRPAEPVPLVGNAAKARAALGWTPDTAFGDLVAEMVEADLAAESR
jgi:GDPmannose 4,6-dehydratase